MIELKNLLVGYSRDKPLLPEINLTIENKIYGIIGKSGVGKTTLLRTIAGLNNPISGSVINPSRERIYMMHQNYTCFDWLNVFDNVLIAAKVNHIKITNEVKTKVHDCINKVELIEFEKYYPAELSGGMRQRLALARTIFVNPPIILMDEPLSALDEDTRKRMQDIIIENHKFTNNIIILITHSHSEAERMCDNIIYITKKGIEQIYEKPIF